MIKNLIKKIQNKFKKFEIIELGSFFSKYTTVNEWYEVFGIQFGHKVYKVIIPPYHPMCLHTIKHEKILNDNT